MNELTRSPALPLPYHEPLPEPQPLPPPRDPATLGYPEMMPVELALGDQTAEEICAGYEPPITRERFCELCEMPAFQKAYDDALLALQKEGMSFKVKARMQSEGLLKTAWNMIHNSQVAANVRADLIKATWRVAGYDDSKKDPSPVVPLAISINLGDAINVVSGR
jgi:hypothetical protein